MSTTTHAAHLRAVDPDETAIPATRSAVTAEELLERPNALLTRSHLAQLGLGRRAIDAVFRQLPVVVLAGCTRPHIRVRDYIELIERSTYRGDRVRPTR